MVFSSCPCCLSPVIVAILLVSIVSFKLLASLSASLFDQHPKARPSLITRSFHFLFLLASLAVLLLSIFLGVLSVSPALKSQFFAQLCGQMTQSPDLDPLRCGLVSGAQGRVLEFGFGPGTNFRCWNESKIEEWVGVDPNTHFQELVLAQKEKHHLTFPTSIVWISGENVDIEPESFDFVIATHTLCSVSNVQQVLSQIARALKPGGRYLFFEHVTSPDKEGLLYYLQLLMAPFLTIVGNGCEFRELWKDLDSVTDPASPLYGFQINISHISAPISLPPLTPHIIGEIRKP